MKFRLSPVIIQSLIVRIRSLVTTSTLLATIIVTHLGLLHLSDRSKDLIELGCLVVIGLSNSPVSRFVAVRHELEVKKSEPP